MHKLLLLSNDEKVRQAYLKELEAANLPDLEIVDFASAEVDLVFGNPALVVDVLPDLPALKWVQATWAGVEPLMDPTMRRDYILTNARGVFGRLMSEYVFGYLLLHERKILQRLEAQKKARWEPSLPGSLYGKTIGLLGVGSIGAHLAETASHFGMVVRGYTRNSQSNPYVDEYYHGENLLDFAKGLDYLVSVLPNTPETAKIIDAQLLAVLPAQAILINVGRGSALDETALITALNNDKLAAAVLDVFDQEPLPSEHPLWSAKNIFITSHTAAPSFPEDISRIFVDNYNNYINNKPLKYMVDFGLRY